MRSRSGLDQSEEIKNGINNLWPYSGPLLHVRPKMSVKIRHWDDMPDVLTADDLASFLGVNKYWVYQKARVGHFPKIKSLGKLTRFNKADIRQVLESDSLKREEEISSRKISSSNQKELRWL